MTTAPPARGRGVTVVTATRRLARHLALVYNREQQAAGRRAWLTPSILTWSDWLAQLWTASLFEGAVSKGRTLLTPFQQAALWRAVAMSDGVVQLPGGEVQLASLASKAWRLCQEWRISDSDLAAAADSSDTLTFARWAAGYRARCIQDGWLDAGMLPAVLALDVQAGRIAVPTQLRLAGFHEWTPLQSEFLRVIAAAGCEVSEEPAPRVADSQASVVACPDSRSELDSAARWSRRHREKNANASVAVVVPDLAVRLPAVRRAFLDVLAPDWRLRPGQQIPVNFSYGQPLSSVGLIHAALLVLGMLRGRVDFRDAGQLLRTPYVAGAVAETGARARADLACRERSGTLIDVAELAAIAGRCAAPEFSRQMLGLSGIIEALPARQPVGKWVETFGAALRSVGWPGDRGLASDEYQAALSWRDQLDQLGACDRISGPTDIHSCLQLLTQAVREAVFQPSGDDTAIQVMGALEAPGHRFDALWLCGMTSDGWPPAARPNPLLPLGLQRRLHMPTASPPAARERAERLLRWLETSASEVILSWPEFHGEEPRSPSPLLGHLRRQGLATVPLWSSARWDQLLVRARATETLANDTPPPIAPGALPLGGGAALLAQQARCPARAFLEFRLGARELRNPSTGLDAATRGSVTHAVLQKFFRAVSDQRQLAALGDDEQRLLLSALIADELRRYLAGADPMLRALVRAEQARLFDLLLAFLQTERRRAPFRVIATEEPLSLAGAPESVQALGLNLRADRVDEAGEGARLVIDYKTGRVPPTLREIWGPRPRAPQLPLYAILANADAVAFLHLSSAGVRWIGVGREAWSSDGILTPERMTKGSAADWTALRASWWSALERLADELLAGDFRVDRWKLDDARGQWAMATRVHELPEMEHGDT